MIEWLFHEKFLLTILQYIMIEKSIYYLIPLNFRAPLIFAH